MAEICRYETNIFWSDDTHKTPAVVRGVASALLDALVKTHPQILNYSKEAVLVKEHERVVIVIQANPEFLKQFPESAHSILKIVSKTVGTTSSKVRKLLH